MPGSKAADSTPQTVRRTEMSGCGDRGAASEASTSATGTRQTGSVWSALETQLQQVESSLRAREAATASAVEARRLAERVRDDAKRECAEAHEAREAEARRTAAARSSLQADAVSLPRLHSLFPRLIYLGHLIPGATEAAAGRACRGARDIRVAARRVAGRTGAKVRCHAGPRLDLTSCSTPATRCHAAVASTD